LKRIASRPRCSSGLGGETSGSDPTSPFYYLSIQPGFRVSSVRTVADSLARPGNVPACNAGAETAAHMTATEAGKRVSRQSEKTKFELTGQLLWMLVSPTREGRLDRIGAFRAD
jgi:hypothetical protein